MTLILFLTFVFFSKSILLLNFSLWSRFDVFRSGVALRLGTWRCMINDSTTNDEKGLLIVWHKNVWWIITHECGGNLIYRVTTSKGFLRSDEKISFFSSFSRPNPGSIRSGIWRETFCSFTAQDFALKSSLIVEFVNPNQTFYSGTLWRWIASFKLSSRLSFWEFYS